MPAGTEQLQILFDVDDDVRADLRIGFEPFPAPLPGWSIPHYDEPASYRRWDSEAYDRRYARMWGF